ncbi:T9SS type A sorting domain-containing protein [Spirosoma pollinicola]|uniref:Secretion system C-terminal sorting domain-containing protein n=1 Tax=Spirosoma pollinicola TaxID=2057025 RepID=A0A2K8Z6V0_9BACT|nr:T9SS type A sorting domain-containing protein [Spirosoma pollinicola]AUD05617.1 hypothetical protein CWM47_29505 [Spirosoma pollinicola]
MNYWTVSRLVLAIGLLSVNPGLAQTSALHELLTKPTSQSLPGSTSSYYSTGYDAPSRIPAPDDFLKRNSPSGRPMAPTAQFIVTYRNFTPEAQRAFQYAVDIWSTLIVSSVPIRIQANWVSQEPNLLGSAGPASYQYSFDGGQKARAFYPVALAEKIARRQLNNPTDPDIIADFNRNNDWYYGTDGKTPKGQTDLVTAVLHELTHGLGFIGFFNVKSDKGDQSDGQYLADLPSVYDHFIENGLRQRLVTSQTDYPNNSIPLNRQLTGGDLFLNGTILRQQTGQKMRLNAPAQFDRSTSIYHLREETYPTGDINSLMTSSLGRAESIHTPGPLVLAFFTDLEWKTTSVLHEPILNSEEVKDFVFTVRVISDTVLTANSVRLVYRKTAPTAKDTVATTVSPSRLGTTDTYQYTLPAAQAQGDIWYYFQAQDASGRTFTNPGKLMNGAQAWYQIHIGPDNTPPTIQYSPSKNSIFSRAVTDSLPIYARITDDRSGLSAAYVEYQVNGVAQANRPLRYSRQTVNNTTYDSVYVSRLDFPANSLKVGDKITYRIVARDSSKAKNQAISPATGYYALTVVAQQAVRDQYINTFSDAATASDFVSYGFSQTTPAGFGDPAIHSEHPYRNGTDFQSQSNAEYVLLSPIRIKANPDSAVIRFDEIVLVEPGDAGSKPGDKNFYDYVVVEGSADNGLTWKPLLDGYSSADKTDWLNAYKSSMATGAVGEQNSTRVGVPALYRHRDIPLLNQKTLFRAGDQILIRFRLLADQLAYGWGWAIDNLRIQAPPAPIVLGVEPISASIFSVYPNPVTTGLLQLEATLLNAVTHVKLNVVAQTGQVLHEKIVNVNSRKLSESLDLSHLAAGLYFLRLTVGDQVLTQKVIVAK